MSTFVFCQALVLLQPGEQLYFIGRTGEPLVSEDEPGELFDYLRLAPLVLGVWLWQGRVAHGDEETRIEVGSSFRRLTEDDFTHVKPWRAAPIDALLDAGEQDLLNVAIGDTDQASQRHASVVGSPLASGHHVVPAKATP